MLDTFSISNRFNIKARRDFVGRRMIFFQVLANLRENEYRTDYVPNAYMLD